MNIHWLQHVEFEGLGCIEPWLEENGHDVSCTRLWAGDSLPPLGKEEQALTQSVPMGGKIDGLIVMGGPMGITDDEQYPWLPAEKTFIKEAIDQELPVLGICLGAQLIADVLGSRVWKNEHKEIGFFPIIGKQLRCGTALRDAWASFFPNLGKPNLKSGTAGSKHWKNQTVFHWHGDTFDIPDGAVRLASSEATENQAFLYKENVLALQFHLETTEESLLQLYKNASDEIEDAPFIQPLEANALRLANENVLTPCNDLMRKLLGRLFHEESQLTNNE